MKGGPLVWLDWGFVSEGLFVMDVAGLEQLGLYWCNDRQACAGPTVNAPQPPRACQWQMRPQPRLPLKPPALAAGPSPPPHLPTI